MYRTPLVLALCCVLAINDASPLVDEELIYTQNILFKSQDRNNEIAKTVLTTDNTNVCEENTNIELSAMKKELLESQTKLRDMVEALIKKQDNLADQISGFSNRSGEEVGWWRALCRDPDDGQRGFKEDTDDSRLRNITGCDVSWNKNIIQETRTQDRQVERLAILITDPDYSTDTNLYLFIDDRMIFYFDFSSKTGRLLFYKIKIRGDPILLWEAEFLTPDEGRQHYLPLELKFAGDGLRWRAGCGGESQEGAYEGLSTTDSADGAVIRLSILNRIAFFPIYKVLHNCPQVIPRPQITN